MNGPQHFGEAELLLAQAGDYTASKEDADKVALVQRAQVHATLALAAATDVTLPLAAELIAFRAEAAS